MKKKGFRDLVSESLKEKIKFQGETKRPRSFLRVEIMMLQLVQRAASGDSKALRRIVKILKKHQPAPPPVRMHFYSLDGNWNVVDETEGTILGHFSEFPDLPYVSGPTQVPKEWLVPKKKRKRHAAPGKELAKGKPA